MINVSYSRTQRSNGSDSRTLCLKSSTLPLSHCFPYCCWVVFFIFYSNFKRNFCKQTVENLIRRLNFAASNLVLHCMPMSHKKDGRFIWVKKSFKINSNIQTSQFSTETTVTIFKKKGCRKNRVIKLFSFSTEHEISTAHKN